MSRADLVSRFQALHAREGAFVIPNPWDVGTARVLASLGFEALATTSAGCAFGHGVPEGAMTPGAVLQHCRDLAAATDLPVSADLENGYGHDPETVAELIRYAAETGLAGGSIEDFTGDEGAPIYAFDHAVERVHAAVEAAKSIDGGFVFTARAENFLYGRKDLDDTIKRLQAFEAAGADVLYAPGLADLDTIRMVTSAVSRPVNVVMGLPGATFGVADLAEAGVTRISVGSALSRHMFAGFISAAREMLDNGTFTFANGAMGFKPLDDMFKGF